MSDPRLTIGHNAIANGDWRMISTLVQRLRDSAPAGAALIVAPASPANPWYRPGDAVDVVACAPEHIDAAVVRYVQSVGEHGEQSRA